MAGMQAPLSFLGLHGIGAKEGPFALYHKAVAIVGQALAHHSEQFRPQKKGRKRSFLPFCRWL